MSRCDKVKMRLGWYVIGPSWPEDGSECLRGIIIDGPSVNNVVIASIDGVTTVVGPLKGLHFVRRLSIEELLTHGHRLIRELGLELSKGV